MVLKDTRVSQITNELTDRVALVTDQASFYSTFSEEYTDNQTNLAIITPENGKKICVRQVIIVTDASSGIVSLDFLTSGKKVARLYTSKENTLQVTDLHIGGDVNEPLSLNTTTGSEKVFIVVNYIQTE